MVSLHGELRILRDGICKSCKRKFQVPVSSEPTLSPSYKSSEGPAKSTISVLPWRRLLKARASDHIPSDSGPSSSEIPRSSISDISQTSHSTLHVPRLSTPTFISSPPPGPTTIHGNETPASTSNPVTTTLSRAIPPKTVPNVRWSARIANGALNVTFVCAFVHKDVARSVRFSADGKYLAAVLKEGNTKGAVIIYDVETGDKNW